MIIKLDLNHPYVRDFSAQVIKLSSDHFAVKWRDFGSTKQENHFHTRLEAEAYANYLKEICRVVRPENYEGLLFEEASEFWGE